MHSMPKFGRCASHSPSTTSRVASPAVTLSQMKHPHMTRLKQERLRLGLSLRDVATSLEPPTTPSHVMSIEEGGSHPLVRTVERLAAFYGVDPSTIVRWQRERIN